MPTRKTFTLIIWISTLFLWALPALAQVDTAWVRRYNGPGNSTDNAHGLGVDALGNVFVTGRSIGSGSQNDYTTIKYYPNGDTAWVRRYNGPGNDDDVPFALAVDNSGNVCVTGNGYTSATNLDLLTVKYYANGDTAWMRAYSSSGDQADIGYAIATDDVGNVYVAGTKEGTYPDYVTIKYDSNGSMQWDRIYNGPGNYYDIVYAVAVDSSGNVYVTGGSTGSGSDGDFATIKYYSDGTTAWVRRYGGPANKNDYGGAIAVDDSGNVYVNGLSGGSGSAYDYATIKYYPNGDTAWVRRHQGPVHSGAIAGDMTIDDSGNVYVTGWNDVGETYSDYLTIKYLTDGDTAWVRKYNGPVNGGDGARDIAVDASGNVYVAGMSSGDGTSGDYATVKYDPEGNEIWVMRYDGSRSSSDDALAVAVDDSGNVYVTGYSAGIGTGADYASIKYVQTSVPRTIHVPADYSTIQEAIDAAADDDTVLVASGIYTGDGNRDIDFKGMAILVRSEKGPDSTVINCEGTPAEPHRGFYFHLGEDSTSILDGFTITGGYQEWGGGIQGNSSPYITNCIITGDSAYNGGGVAFGGGTPIFGNCKIVDNSVGHVGGGLCFTGPRPTMRNCTIENNRAWAEGGDWYGGRGGAIYGAPNMENCLIANNWAEHLGGALNPRDCGVYNITNCTFIGNLALVDGSCAFFDASVYPAIKNTIIAYHSGNSNLYCWGVANPSFQNCDVWGNSAGNSLCGTDLGGNISLDPMFCNLQTGNFHLWDDSPCVGTGTGGANIGAFGIGCAYGDANGNGMIDVGDVVYLINYLYKNGPAPDPLEAGDCNCDGVVDVGDVVYLVDYLYKGGSPPSC